MRAYDGLRANRPASSRCGPGCTGSPITAASTTCGAPSRWPSTPTDPPSAGLHDPVAKVEQRDALRRLIADVQRLPEQQRSALLMRELSGMAYCRCGRRARGVGAGGQVAAGAGAGRPRPGQRGPRHRVRGDPRRPDLGPRPRRPNQRPGPAPHARCQPCREFRSEVRGVSRQLAALTPTLGPLGVIANLLGLGGGGGGAVRGGGSAVAGRRPAATAGGSAAAVRPRPGFWPAAPATSSRSLAAAVVTAGGAVEIQSTLSTAAAHHSHRPALIAHAARSASAGSGAVVDPDGGASIAAAVTGSGTVAAASRAARLRGPTGMDRSGRRGNRRSPAGDPDHRVSRPGHVLPSEAASGRPEFLVERSERGSGRVAGLVDQRHRHRRRNEQHGPTGTSATGSGATPGSSTAAGSGSDSASASSGSSSSTGESGSSAASQGSSTSASTAPTTASSTGASGTGSGASTSSSTSTGVGKSTTAASSGSVVSFIQHRRSRHRRRLDTLISR